MLFKSLYVPSGDLNRPRGNRQYWMAVMREQELSWLLGSRGSGWGSLNHVPGRRQALVWRRLGRFTCRTLQFRASIQKSELLWCEYGGVRVKAGLYGSQAERQSQGAEGVGIPVHDRYRRLNTLKADGWVE